MLNKALMIEGFRSEFITTRGDAERAIAWFFDTIKKELQDGGDVRINEFATLSTYTRKGANGRNPRTGEAIVYPSKRTLRLKPSKVFISELNG